MKWIIVLALILIAAGLIALRYRKQIQMGLYVFRMFRKMRQMNRGEEKKIDAPVSAAETNLVSCAKCGTWIPQNKALKLRQSVYYCSSKCLENTVKV